MIDDTWTIQRILHWTRDYFASKGIESARLDAELLLAESLGSDRMYLYTHFDKPLSAQERAGFKKALVRRANLEPVAYILGRQEFFGREFEVGPQVLIPRPETEHLIEEALAWLARNHPASEGAKPIKVLDIGTGSGCLAVTLACERPDLEIVATDLSQEALKVAEKNAHRHGVQVRIRFLHGDLWQPVQGQQFDLILSNPPYVEESEKESLQKDVVDYEPHMALFSGTDGMDALRLLAQDLDTHLHATGAFICEFGHQQGPAVEAALVAAGFGETQKIQDLAGHFRGLLAQRSKQAV